MDVGTASRTVHGCSDQLVGGKYPAFESYATNKLNLELELEYQKKI